MRPGIECTWCYFRRYNHDVGWHVYGSLDNKAEIARKIGCHQSSTPLVTARSLTPCKYPSLFIYIYPSALASWLCKSFLEPTPRTDNCRSVPPAPKRGTIVCFHSMFMQSLQLAPNERSHYPTLCYLSEQYAIEVI